MLSKRATVVCALAFAIAALAPATASAAPQWQQLTDPPGGDAITLVSGVPHVAYVSSAGVRVVRPTPSGDGWQQVGGPIRHTSGKQVFDPSLAEAPDHKLWVAWTEIGDLNRRQARVARLDGNVWHEVVGGAQPINMAFDPHYTNSFSAYEPALAFFGGTVYVAYTQDSPSEYLLGVVRLKADGTAFERLDPPPADRHFRPRIAVSGGRLYVASTESLIPSIFVARLNPAGTGWTRLPEPPPNERAFFGDLADIGGSPAVLYAGYDSFDVDVVSLGAGDAWGPIGPGPLATSDVRAFDAESLVAVDGVPYAAWLEGAAAPHSVQVARLSGGDWSRLPSPSAAGADAVKARLAAGSAGVFVMWGEGAAPATQWHVAKLGEPVAPPPPDNGGGNGGDGDTGGDGGNPPAGPPEVVPTSNPGACGVAIVGSRLADILTGTAARNSISGGAGNDRLFGLGGGDCLFGGSGNDLIRGGRGRDELYGDAGNDRIFGGPGADDIDAGRGNDRVDVRGGGSDSVDCGPGRDTVLADAGDAVWRCERVVSTG
jgi:hypothetical protein